MSFLVRNVVRRLGAVPYIYSPWIPASRLLCCRDYCAAPPTVDLNSASYIVWGAGTDVGKTLVSSGVALSAALKKERLLYVKPVQTGFPGSCDSKTVASVCEGGVVYGPHARAFQCAEHISNRNFVQCHTLFAWGKPASPHLAEKEDARENVTDHQIVEEIAKTLALSTSEDGLCLIETAGGVCSPFPSESLQCDALRPLRLPSVLVGDNKLGGISATLTAYDSLLLRGYDVVAVVLILSKTLDNAEYLSHNFREHKHWAGGKRPVVVVLPEIPECEGAEKQNSSLQNWFGEAQAPLDALTEHLKNMYARRCEKLRHTVFEASNILWWPFTQHKNVEKKDMAVFDSRWGDHLSVIQPMPFKQWKMQPQFDACASWWTQGLGSIYQPELARALAYASGRYGHVIFPENVHDAVLECSKKLLETVGRPWGSRVFYSDNGSTAVEVGLKMGLRLFLAHNRQRISDKDEMQILGFANSYHGDTLGAMDASPASVFNKSQFPWYKQQGVFITPPSLFFSKGHWHLQIPEDWPREVVEKIPNIGPLGKVNLEESRSTKATLYRNVYASLIASTIDKHNAATTEAGGRYHVASMLMEPVLQGAGGMVLIDPLFQQEAIRVCQEKGIPVILDEVFTGFWRLGALTGAELLGAHPDIACFAKLLTGGMVPMAVTLTGKAAFKAFWGKYKTNALLHGHSYTAHPVGCVAACTALDIMNDPKSNPNIIERSQEDTTSETEDFATPSNIPNLRKNPISGSYVRLWDDGLVTELSRHKKVHGIIALGTVCAVSMKNTDEVSGYRSTKAREVTDRLRTRGVFARPLGDVVYIMVGLTTTSATCARLLTVLKQELDVES